jgi:hypothetical protein
VSQLCTTVPVQNDASIYQRVLSLIKERSGHGLYEPVTEARAADIEVRSSNPDADPICISDAFGHEALRFRLSVELGSLRASDAMLSQNNLVRDLPIIVRVKWGPR